MYDLEAEWVDIPVTPQHANAVIQQSPAKNVGISVCFLYYFPILCDTSDDRTRLVHAPVTAILTTLSTSQASSQNCRGETASGFTLVGTAV